MSRPEPWSARRSGRVERTDCFGPGEAVAEEVSAAEYSAASAAETYHRQRPPRPGLERVRRSHVEATAAAINSRDVAVLRELARVRVLSGGQLERLLFGDVAAPARDRVRRRVLRRLQDWRLVTTLERRVGGVRAGSAGFIYALDSGGARLLASGLVDIPAGINEGRIRRPTTPGSRFLRHTLSVAELYVSLREEAERGDEDRWRLDRFDAEPACWWPDGLGGQLKPDAHAALSDDRYQYSWWIEVDLGTESLPTVNHKLRRYSDFHLAGGLGPDGVTPRVLVTVSDAGRQQAIERLAAAFGTPHLFTTAQTSDAVERLRPSLTSPEREA